MRLLLEPQPQPAETGWKSKALRPQSVSAQLCDSTDRRETLCLPSRRSSGGGGQSFLKACVSLNVCLAGWLASLPGGRWVFCRTEVSVVWSTVSRVRRGVWRQSSTATCEDLFCQSTITNVQSQFTTPSSLSSALSTRSELFS